MVQKHPLDWHWYIAEVKNNTERSTYKRLSEKIAGIENPDYEVFLPLMSKETTRGTRKVKTQVPCLKGYLFIHCTDDTRLEIARIEPNIKSYFIAPSIPHRGTKRTPYIMPDKVMEEYMRFVEAADEDYMEDNLYAIIK